jgi:hypothetical protein
MRIQFVITKETFTAKVAEWMYATFHLIFWHALLLSALRRGKVGEILGRRVQGVFV